MKVKIQCKRGKVKFPDRVARTLKKKKVLFRNPAPKKVKIKQFC